MSAPTPAFAAAAENLAAAAATLRPRGGRRVWRLSRCLLALVIGTATLSIGVVLALALAWRLPAGEALSQAQVRREAVAMAVRSEVLLGLVEDRVQQLARLIESTPPAIGVSLVSQALRADDLIDMVALTAADGSVRALGLRSGDSAALADATGLDLSGSPLVRAGAAPQRLRWHGRHLSLVTGELAVGLSVQLADGSMLVAEIALDRLVTQISRLHGLELLETAGDSAIWVVDERGEILADTEAVSAVGRVNLLHTALLDAAGRPGDTAVPQLWRHERRDYNVSAVRSAQLGWTFVARQLHGLDHPRTLIQIGAAALALLLTPAFCLALLPLLARPVSAALDDLVAAASDERAGRHVAQWPQGPILELNQLSGQLGSMANQIHLQKDGLLRLNAELEQRVAERIEELSDTNAALRTSMDELHHARDDLVRNERLASLGGLVAGVAHELNTPLGNGLLAISTVQDALREFRATLAQGLRKSALEGLLESVDTAADIAGRNIGRAADLVTSFKQVAVDQTSGLRRRFDLQAVILELLHTLQPTLARTPYRLEVDVPAGLMLDSYPGALGQILTNLVNNAVLHGFDGREHGVIRVQAAAQPGGGVVLSVHDDGRGIPAAVQGRVFDPFFTTRMGRGGTGLGMNIAHSMARNVLGGSLGLRSEEGVGTSFMLHMPCVAPLAGAGQSAA